ncbi:MAG: hypothetical protein BV457_05850 [Thermoplasmata archaeon M9B1D]|nr:MAG: hypothetical protein BV457_05850 [Thermoplasmata archaeon M9B1D]
MTIEEVSNKLKEHGYKLLDTKYKNNKSPINIEKDGYKYFTPWNCICKTWKPKMWSISNPYSIENIKKYMKENNFNCELISEEYDYKEMKLKCKCGKIYSCGITHLIHDRQENCPKCSIKIVASKHMKNKYLDYIKIKNLKIIGNYSSCKNTIYCMDEDNYYLKFTLYNALNGSNIYDSLFDMNNIYVINNIKNYIKINNLNVELLTKKFNGHSSNIRLKCKECSNEYETNFYYFLSTNKIICNNCARIKSLKNRIKYDYDIFKEYGLEMIEKYNGHSKRIYCLNEDGYYVYCSPESLKNINDSSSTIFHSCNKYIIKNIKNFININGLECELLSKEYKSSKDKLVFKCSCGNTYYNTIYSLRNGISTLCKGCGKINVKSKMEDYVERYLNSIGIENYREKTFIDCRDKYLLPFDFYLPIHNICIECQGKQHYEPIDYFGGEKRLEYVKYHDKIKREYCKENGIELIEISYIDFNKGNIENIINNYIKK